MATIDSARWRELSPHLDHALELSVAERTSWLERVRTADPTLAADLRAMLDAYSAATAEGFLKGTPAWPVTDATLAGRTFGAYTLEAPIGQGGMGSVWRARRSDDQFEGVAAIKLLNLALIGHKGAERFKREASILAKLQHPNIARLLDAGVSELGQPYLVLEYIEGERIDDYCDARRLPVDARLRLFLHVLAAVEHAHSMLIVHRDIKPSNLLVTRDGAVKLLDFGIAKLLADDAGDGGRSDLTREDTRVLTPDFAAPEQLLGAAVTTATDIHALGVLLYILLCGRHPALASARSPAERMSTLVDRDAPRLSNQLASAALPADALAEHSARRGTTVEKLRRQLAGDLDNIVAKALKAEPRERYESVARFADDIRRHLDNEPVSARADTFAYRVGKFVRKHRVGVATTALTVLALAAATTVTTWQMLEARAQRDQARYQARRAQAVNDFMKELMAQPGPATPVELLDSGRTKLAKQYTSDPAFVVSMLIGISGRYMDLSRIDKELETLEQAERIARAQRDDELLASVQCNTVDTEVRLGRNDRAAARMDEARRALARVRNVRVGLTVSCLNAETYLARSRGDVDAAIGHARTALAVLERSGVEDLDYTNYTMMLSRLSALYAQKGLFKESHQFTVRIREMDERIGRGGTMGAVITAHNEAVDYVRFGEIRAADSMERSVIERLLQTPNAAEAIAPEIASLYGQIQCLLGRNDEGLPWLRFSIWRAHAVGDPIGEARSKVRLAGALIDSGDADEAEPLLDEASRVLHDDAERNGKYNLEIARARAQVLLKRNRIADAVREIDALLADIGDPRSVVASKIQYPLLTAAEIHLRSGDLVVAESHARAALTATESVADDAQQSADVGRALLLLGQVRYAKGDARGARDAFERARTPIANGLGDEHPLARELASWIAKLG